MWISPALPGLVAGVLLAALAAAAPITARGQHPEDRAAAQSAGCVATVGYPPAAEDSDPDALTAWREEMLACLHAAGSADIEVELLKRIRVSEEVTPLGPTPFGEQVSLYNGALSFRQIDIDLPGNGPPLQLVRELAISARPAYGLSWDSGTIPANGFGDWALAIPHIDTLSAQPEVGVGQPWWFVDTAHAGAQRCSELARPPVIGRNLGNHDAASSPIEDNADWGPEHWWAGVQLVVPGAGRQDIGPRHPDNALFPQPMVIDGHSVNFIHTTEALWAIGCLPATSNGVVGEGFLAVSPDGTRYFLDHLARYPAASISDPSTLWSLARTRVRLLASRVEDRFGNSVTYAYNADDTLASITASDGRRISFEWETWSGTGSPTLHHVVSATAEASDAPSRTWGYAYAVAEHTSGTQLLHTVTLPDNTQWVFDLTELQQLDTGGATTFHAGSCEVHAANDPYHGEPGTGTIIAPSGLTGSFKLQVLVRGRSHVVPDCGFTPGPGTVQQGTHPAFYALVGLREKTFSGPGVPARTWQYDYSPPNGGYYNQAPADTVWTRVTNPVGEATVSTFSNRFDTSESRLLEVAVHKAGPTSQILRRETHAWRAPYFGPNPLPDPVPWPTQLYYPLQNDINLQQAGVLAREYKRQIHAGTDTWTWEATAFNAFGQTTATSRGNNFFGEPDLIETDSWRNDTTRWVLGLPRVHQVLPATGSAITEREYIYRADSTLKERHAFGALVMSYTWHGDGTLASFTDANAHVTTLADYKRGVPGTITHPDGKTTLTEVDDFGQILAVTDELDQRTEYEWDVMGRPTRITWPQEPAGPAWHARTFTYTRATTAARGLPTGHWRRTVSEGYRREVSYHDALWQVRLTDTFDNRAAAAGTTRAFAWDHAGREIFRSWPAAGQPALGSLNTGTRTERDALGRIVQVETDSELGPLVVQTEYLAGNRTQVTDPRGQQTKTRFQSFDAPTLEAPIEVVFAPGKLESSTLTVTRDLFGAPLQMQQSATWQGQGLAVTHSFDYDSRHRRCRHIGPETGTTSMGYDPAGNLLWKLEDMPAGVDPCAPGYVPAPTVGTHYAYDVRNRLIAVNYADSATANKSFTWYANGAPKTASRTGTGPDAPASTWSFSYLRRGLLKSETLDIAGHLFEFTHGYTSGGQPASLHYPSGLLVDFDPDALGRPRQLGTWLTDLAWAPGGQLAAARYGNGIEANWTWNTRQLLGQTRYTRTGAPLSERSLVWDAAGNLTDIDDAVSACGAGDTIFCNGFEPGGTGTGTWQFAYDNLDRLQAVTNPLGLADAFTYDPLGNLRTASDLGRWDIDPDTNRISQRVQGTSTFPHGWDTRGNLTFDGERSLTWNDAGELVAASDAASRYAYDAAGWRVRAQEGTGAPLYSLYDRSQRLLARWDAATGTETDFLHVGGRMLARIEVDTPTYILPDWQGSPLFETDANASTTRQPVYLGYGRTDAEGRSQIPGYTGATMDPATGQTYLGARYLHQKRFTSPDPAPLKPTHPAGLNRYAYANNNPVRFTDRTGLAPDTDFGLGALTRTVSENYSSFEGAAPYAAAAAGILGAAPLLALAGEAALANPYTTLQAVNLALEVTAGDALGGASLTAASAMATKGAIKEGTNIFRVWGGKAGPWGKSWTTINPNSVSNLRSSAGLPDVNTGRFVSEGTLKSTEGVSTRGALIIKDGQKGGLPEVVIKNPEYQIELHRVSGVNPEF